MSGEVSGSANIQTVRVILSQQILWPICLPIFCETQIAHYKIMLVPHVQTGLLVFMQIKFTNPGEGGKFK